MPSRKKAKGKARKAANKAKEEEAHPAAADQEISLSLTSQMQRLQLEDLLRECNHGLSRHNDEAFCLGFIQAFEDAARFDANGRENDLDTIFNTTLEVIQEKFAAVVKDAVKLKGAISFFLGQGAQLILEQGCDSGPARRFASFASCLEQGLAVTYYESQPEMNTQKIAELTWADNHTLVSFFRKRIPCSCLDDTYKIVKSMPKTGLCCNPSCTRPNRIAQRKTMMYCARCREANYCSQDCHKAAWPRHKNRCKEWVELKAEFELKQQARI